MSLRITRASAAGGPQAAPETVQEPAAAPLEQTHQPIAEEAPQDRFLDHAQALLAPILETTQSLLGGFAADAAFFTKTLEQVFGEDYDREAAEAVRKASAQGDFDWLPPVELVDERDMQGALGAYDAREQVVFLNRGITQNVPRAADAYLEEIGHHLDVLLQPQDTRGDEGELFRRLVRGEKLSNTELRRIRNEDDHGFLTVEKKRVRVEFWKFRQVVDWVKSHALIFPSGIQWIYRRVEYYLPDYLSEDRRRSDAPERRRQNRPKPFRKLTPTKQRFAPSREDYGGGGIDQPHEEGVHHEQPPTHDEIAS